MSRVIKASPSIVHGVTPILGKSFVLKNVGNKMVIEARPKPKKKRSEKQKESARRFKVAQQYAREILKKPGMKELYSKGITDKLKAAHQVAATDYLRAPKIHYVNLDPYHGVAGDVIRIKVTDNFQVTEVKVRITGRHGRMLEQGTAECYRRKAFMWLYKTTVANPDLENTVIRVIARDRPMNEAVLEVKVAKK